MIRKWEVIFDLAISSSSFLVETVSSFVEMLSKASPGLTALGPGSLFWSDAFTNLCTNGSAACKWKLHCHWLIVLWQHQGADSLKMSSYLYRKSHCGDKTILRPSYLHNGISYTGKMSSVYWIRAVVIQGPGGRFKNTALKELLKFQFCIKIKYFNVWVRYFVWNFKDPLWNSTQNILPIYWKLII